jgi:hypothetical protein
VIVVAFDAGMLSILIHPDATLPDDPATGKPLVGAKERIEFLVAKLTKDRATILIPTPALAEFLFVVDESGANYLRVLNTYAVFDIKEFDVKAAIECAESQRKAFATGDKKSGAKGFYQKSKVDRQVISVAKAWNAEAIYTTDQDVVNMAKSIGGIIGVAIWDLPLPTDADAAALDVPPSPTSDLTTGDLFSSSDFEPPDARSPDAEPET